MVAEPRGLSPGSQLLKSLTDLGQGLACGILDILGQMTLCCGHCLVPCGMFGSTLGLRCQYPCPSPPPAVATKDFHMSLVETPRNIMQM